MATRQYCCFLGRGVISAAGYADYLAKVAGLIPLGNAPVLNLTATETTETVKDYTSPAGGTFCSRREIDAVAVALTLRCHSPHNWALATSGSGYDNTIASAAVEDEPHVLHLGAVEPLTHLIDDNIPVVVTSPDGDTTYVAGVDYIVTPSGSIEHVVGGSIPAPTITTGKGQPNIAVSYTRREQRLIQLYSQPARELTLHFDGYNVAEGGADPTHFDLFRVQFGPAATVNVISDNIAQLELTGNVLRDPTRPLGTISNPFSQYGTLKI
ncbi:hypothetical protein [Pigmentiphaga kullae]|uniref:Uncharacterized protein n=1 Tax=Pigmentiphaga kullae TaxID=151784 RepID=A0A4Q7NLP5_9BURK|nr:hypothetical protein [Pigmentiphaga kullae]RZS86071.1 hypothetical protein EV675_2105 [Pigmentiphaga kullae]